MSYDAPRLSARGLVVVVALHVGALWALARMELISLPPALAVLSVSLLPPAINPEPAPPIVEPPKPRPVEKTPPPPVVPLAPVALPVDAPVEAPATAPVVQAPVAPPIEAVAPPAPAPMAIPTPPRFDANYLDNPKPTYPPLARRLGEEGRVVVRVRVGPNGLPLDVALHTGSGSARLDAAALDTVRRWKFVPARLGSEAVAASVLVPIVFSLKE